MLRLVIAGCEKGGCGIHGVCVCVHACVCALWEL